MTRKIIFASVLLFLVGCQRETFEWPDDNRPNPDGSVRFRIKADDAVAEADGAQTRGTPRATLEAYDSVCVNVFSHTADYEVPHTPDIKFFQKVVLEQKTPNWVPITPLFWPVEKKLSFFAYASDIFPYEDAGISFLKSEGRIDSIKYKVPSVVELQPDLLVSSLLNQSETANISLTMKHALACVSFCGTAPEGSTYVKSITLRNVYGEGALALNTSSIVWKVNPKSKGITVFKAGTKGDVALGKDPLPDNDYLMKADGYLMMIPQKLTNAAIDVLYWNGTDEAGDKLVTYILPVDKDSYGTWKPGQKYVYKFGSQSEEDITVVYYEKYADGAYGLYYYDEGLTLRESLINTKEIVEAGYGVLTKKSKGDVLPIRLSSPDATPAESGKVVALTEINSFLYPVSQSASSTFALSPSTIPQNVYFNGSNQSCGMIVPHFAKGVSPVETRMTDHCIRTPQQMRNITWSDASSAQKIHTYTQELDLDFSKVSIGGVDLASPLTTPVVNREFYDLFKGQNKKIGNVRIHATTVNGGLFLSNSGELDQVVLVNSSIISDGNTGGIAAANQASGVITSPRVIGEDNLSKSFTIQGSSYVGAIAGVNYGKITGNIAPEVATELPVAEVSGWGVIKGSAQPVGGIVGENLGTITTCLVNGVYVKDLNKGDVEKAKITIEGGDYVGGIVGVNRKTVDGNYSMVQGKKQAEPDVAGLVSISGNDFVGGIAGQNSGAEAVLNQVNLRLGRGDKDNAITITGNVSVGGIVGYNTEGATLKAEGNSFISVRGNVIIKGVENVGGIAGKIESGNISNCFVYNFYSQDFPLTHHAPKISGQMNVGGIVGYITAGAIRQCAVFSTVSDQNKDAGESVANATAQITATAIEKSSAGGIAGQSFSGGVTIAESYVLGNVRIDGANFSGGIVGQNRATSIKSVHVGNSGVEVDNIYKLFSNVGLPVKDERMKTNGGVMTKTSGTPTIVGTIYVGGICGVNWGTVSEVFIRDNVRIGTSSANFVGGIAGGNGVGANIINCTTYNPAGGAATVEIVGQTQVGGIVGLNNGIVDNCKLGLPGLNSSGLITIKGRDALGGIAGTNGGNEKYSFDGSTVKGTGNERTCVKNCNVYGKVLIEAISGLDFERYRIGGIIGENGLTNSVVGCNVIGYASGGTSTSGYDVTLKGAGSVGGIAGVNYGYIFGAPTSPYSKVTNTAVIATNMYAGGLVGVMKSDRKYDSDFEGAKLYYCDVSYGVLIYTWENMTGAFAGQIEGVGAEAGTPTLFGTSPAPGGAKNKIYTGASNPVYIGGNNRTVLFPPLIDRLPYPIPADPHRPDVIGNFWANYQMNNYLYYTVYEN